MTEATSLIEDVMREYRRAWSGNDMDAWGALFTDDCDFVGWRGDFWRSREENVSGHKAVPAFVQNQRSNYDVQIEDVDVLSSDLALVHALWTWRAFVATPGEQPEDRAGILTMVMVKRDGLWRIRASHNARCEP